MITFFKPKLLNFISHARLLLAISYLKIEYDAKILSRVLNFLRKTKKWLKICFRNFLPNVLNFCLEVQPKASDSKNFLFFTRVTLELRAGKFSIIKTLVSFGFLIETNLSFFENYNFFPDLKLRYNF